MREEKLTRDLAASEVGTRLLFVRNFRLWFCSERQARFVQEIPRWQALLTSMVSWLSHLLAIHVSRD